MIYKKKDEFLFYFDFLRGQAHTNSGSSYDRKGGKLPKENTLNLLTLVQNEKFTVAHDSSSQSDNLALSYGEIISTTCNLTVQGKACFIRVSLERVKSRCA